MIKLTKDLCRQALMGGLLLGGGGGGTLTSGYEALEETFKYTDAITLLDVTELPADAVIANVSTLGAPSATDMHLTAKHWKKALENFEEKYGKKVAGFTSCENGAISTANGWILSALTEIPIIDAPSNGRAHPTGTMGSIGLNTDPTYVTTQSACGGEGDHYLETVASGALQPTSAVIRASAAADGGMVAVIRNPVTASYLRSHAAVGAIKQALSIGAIFEKCQNGQEFVDKLIDSYDAKFILQGKIAGYELKQDGGYDIGHLCVSNENEQVELTFWNEYMLAEQEGQRICTFPDLMVTLDAQTGEAVSTAEARNGRDVFVLYIPKDKLILGAGMHQVKLFQEVEALLHKDMTKCNADLFN